MATKRRFELVDGTSSKFWEIAVDGASHSVWFGRIGTNGQTKAKTFASEKEATTDADKLVKEKLGKGYREITAEGPAQAEPAKLAKSAPAKSEPEPAVRTTLKAPHGRSSIVLTLSGARLVTDDVGQVFASAAEAKRQLEGIVRLRQKEGYTLGAVDIVGDESPQEEQYVHVDDTPPEAEEPTVSYDEHHRWRLTFEGGRGPDAKACAALAAKMRNDAPAVVQIICDFASPGAAWATALANAQLPSVKDFIFDTYFQTQTRQRENSLGDLRATLDACPSLERFFATGALALTKGRHATLRELYALGDPLSPDFLRALAQWKLPALERLVLSLASDAGPGDDDAAIAALTRLEAPKLHTVHIDSLADVPRVLGGLVASGRVRSWKELRLSGGLDEDALIDVVERHADMLRALDVVGLPLGDELSSDGDGKLRALCASVCDLSELPDVTLPAVYDSWRGASA